MQCYLKAILIKVLPQRCTTVITVKRDYYWKITGIWKVCIDFKSSHVGWSFIDGVTAVKKKNIDSLCIKANKNCMNLKEL